MGLISWAIEAAAYGYRKHEEGISKRDALFRGRDLLAYYSQFYQADPAGARGMAALPFGADEQHQNIYRFYCAKVFRTRGDHSNSIMTFQQLVNSYSHLLSFEQRQWALADLHASHYNLRPDELSVKYDSLVTQLFERMFPRNFQLWIIQQPAVPQQQALQPPNVQQQPAQNIPYAQAIQVQPRPQPSPEAVEIVRGCSDRKLAVFNVSTKLGIPHEQVERELTPELYAAIKRGEY